MSFKQKISKLFSGKESSPARRLEDAYDGLISIGSLFVSILIMPFIIIPLGKMLDKKAMDNLVEKASDVYQSKGYKVLGFNEVYSKDFFDKKVGDTYNLSLKGRFGEAAKIKLERNGETSTALAVATVKGLGRDVELSTPIPSK